MYKLKLRATLLTLALGGTFAVVPVAQGVERSWSVTYNAEGLIESSDGPRTDVNDITRYEYDSSGYLARVTNALEHSTAFSNFDLLGNPQTIVDPNGVVTALTYAPQGWLTSVSTAGNTMRFDHNAVGDITKLTLGDGSWIDYVWDDARRLTRINNSLGEQIEFDLDPMGNRTAIRLIDSAGNLTNQHRRVYDELGRLLYSIGAAGQTVRMQHDMNDNLITTTDPRNYNHTRAYDPLDRLVRNTDPLNGHTNFEYDAQDNLTQINDPRGVLTRYRYDGLGNLMQLDSPDSGTSTYKYDASGNITEKNDGRGKVTSFTYDALNRLTTRRYPANPELDSRFHYDSTAEGNKGVGRLTAVEDINGVLSYIYDVQGNITAQFHTPRNNEATQLDKLSYGYDGGNQLNRIEYPAGFNIVYLRNAAGQINQVQIRRDAEEPIPFVSEIVYLPFGPLESLKWNNGTTLQRAYDLDYQLTAQIIADWSNSYVYDATGNITKIQSSSLGDLSYNYDALNRLTEETNATQQQTFTYDAVGNRTSKNLSPLVEGDMRGDTLTNYHYGHKNNRLTQINDAPVNNDDAGNLIKDSASRQFSYDDKNRLKMVKIDGKTQAQFIYNPLGQRTQKITLQGITTFLYGLGGELLGETRFDSQGLKLTSQYYIWLEGLPLGGVSVTYDTNGAFANSTLFYLHSDHLNTPRIATNSAKNIVWEWKSDAFGVGKASGPLTLNLRFPGQYYDAETELHYNYFRDYNPNIGRYLESDPIGLKGGLNTYGYANGNPLKYIDPLGLESIFGWSAKAEAEAIESKLPGGHNGPQDAYRHCVASCMIASSNWGETVSRIAGWAHEASNFGQSRSERTMDDWNNQAGICAAKGNGLPENCPKSCMTLLKNGALITETNSEGAYY